MAKTNLGLVEYVKSKIGTPYIYGAKMEVITRNIYENLKRQYGKLVWDTDASKIGKVCVDCSGLISAYTGILRGSSAYHDAAKNIYPISSISKAPIGALVWKTGHIGVYVGNGKYIAADGSRNGVRRNNLPGVFTHWFLCSDIEYTNSADKNQVKPEITITPEKREPEIAEPKQDVETNDEPKAKESEPTQVPEPVISCPYCGNSSKITTGDIHCTTCGKLIKVGG